MRPHMLLGLRGIVSFYGGCVSLGVRTGGQLRLVAILRYVDFFEHLLRTHAQSALEGRHAPRNR